MPARLNPTVEQLAILCGLPPGFTQVDLGNRLGVHPRVATRWARDAGVRLATHSESARARMLREWSDPAKRAARAAKVAAANRGRPGATAGTRRVFVPIPAFVPAEHRALFLTVVRRDGAALAARAIRRLMGERQAEPVAPGAVQRIAQLERELEEAQEQLALFRREFLGGDLAIPVDWGLTRTERRLAALLLLRPMVTRDQAMMAIYGDRPDREPEPKIIDVMLSKLRGKAERHGLRVERVHGEGWYVPEALRRPLLRQVRVSAPARLDRAAPVHVQQTAGHA